MALPILDNGGNYSLAVYPDWLWYLFTFLNNGHEELFPRG
jgi:hypothetical protein